MTKVVGKLLFQENLESQVSGYAIRNVRLYLVLRMMLTSPFAAVLFIQTLILLC